jgi:hypothetical protein
MEQTKFTAEEYQQMKDFLASIKDYMPEDKAVYVWDSFQRISGDTSNRPCTCGSAGKHWGNAINTMREYVKEVEN